MTDEIRAQRAIVQLGETLIEGFMLPDGSYKMSLTQAAESVGLGVLNASDFLRSKALKFLMSKDYTLQDEESPSG